jgi:hypothetical protein
VSTKFGTAGQLPDLRGYFVRGHGTNSDGTVSTGNLGRKQSDVFKSHTHSVNDPTHRHTYTDQVAVQNSQFINPGGTGQDGASDLGRFTGYSATGITINAIGDPVETRPKNISLLYCIKY